MSVTREQATYLLDILDFWLEGLTPEMITEDPFVETTEDMLREAAHIAQERAEALQIRELLFEKVAS